LARHVSSTSPHPPPPSIFIYICSPIFTHLTNLTSLTTTRSHITYTYIQPQTTYTLTLTNTPSGVDSLVNAKPPSGVLTISGKWRVENSLLSEDVEIDANFMMKKVAKSNVDRTHPEQHVKLLQAARA
jgi:hypothetical protein